MSLLQGIATNMLSQPIAPLWQDFAKGFESQPLWQLAGNDWFHHDD